ncbi:nitrite reductase [Ilyomonas limi]|uniref:Nitrite reductase n=1 Tax=Ilyomonas limi TaxID=2575867 RepID=A0A4U3L3E0_9BACT|nr:multicopper oxidase domain-containing protein [Ilyomonas limi]TKK68804.1 nitrite reductase [Ilyomonas limi]
MKNTILFLLCVVLGFGCKTNNNNDSDNTAAKGVATTPQAVVTSGANIQKQTGPLAYGPNVPKVPDGDTVEIKFDVTHKLFQVKKDVLMAGWLFGDSIPGPIIHVRVGQTVKFSMTNRSSDSTMSNMSLAMNMESMKPMQHSIDFHAGMVNPEDKYRSIAAGETIHFMWTAHYPGVFMYHCGTPMVLMHMISGMVGMVIVDPKDGFPDHADREFALVQNEYYLKQASGSVYAADTIAALHRDPTYVTFNGKVSQYVFRPLRVKVGERIRVYFLNVGPNNISSFHVIGTILDKVWLDGNPANEFTGMQAVLVGPAQGAIIDFVLPEKGSYTFLDHSFANATEGAAGVFIAE